LNNNTPALLNAVISSVSQPVRDATTGEQVLTTNPEDLKYRFMNIKSDNFAAFLHAAFAAKRSIDERSHDFPSLTYHSIRSQVHGIVEDYLRSVTGKSSEAGGALIKMLLADTQTNVHYFSELKSKGIMSKLGNLSGDRQAEATLERNDQRGARS